MLTIAGGIVLAIVILYFLPEIITISFGLIALAIGVAVIGLIVWLFVENPVPMLVMTGVVIGGILLIGFLGNLDSGSASEKADTGKDWEEHEQRNITFGPIFDLAKVNGGIRNWIEFLWLKRKPTFTDDQVIRRNTAIKSNREEAKIILGEIEKSKKIAEEEKAAAGEAKKRAEKEFYKASRKLAHEELVKTLQKVLDEVYEACSTFISHGLVTIEDVAIEPDSLSATINVVGQGGIIIARIQVRESPWTPSSTKMSLEFFLGKEISGRRLGMRSGVRYIHKFVASYIKRQVP